MKTNTIVPVEFGDEEFSLKPGTVEYLVEIDPAKEWERRGFKASNYLNVDLDVTKNRLGKIVQNKMKNYRERISEFIKSTVNIYAELCERQNVVHESFLPSREFVFVIGPPRSGGTYLLRELFKMQDKQLKTFHHKLVSDSHPADSFLYRWHEQDSRNHLVFDLAQWLQWVKETHEDIDYIPKKHWNFGLAIPIIDAYFGPVSTYLVTSRHPGEIAQSHAQRHGLDDPSQNMFHEGFAQAIVRRDKSFTYDELETYSFNRLVWNYWQIYYEDFLDHEPFEGEIKTIPFGPEREDFVREFANKIIGQDHQPVEFDPSDRELGSFWDKTEVKESIKEVNTRWKNKFGTELINENEI